MTQRANDGRVDAEWPSHIRERTPPRKRERASQFEVTEDRTFSELRHLLVNRLGAAHVRFVTDKQHKPDGSPYAGHSDPADPGVIVFFQLDGIKQAFCCDHYDSVRDNARDIYLCLRDKLRIQGRHSATERAEFKGYEALPPPTAASLETAVQADEPAHLVLGVSEDAPERVIRAAFKAQAMEHHPDRGDGNSREFQRLVRARDKLLEARHAQ